MEDTIQVTNDYEGFKLIEANREQSRGHVEALKAAFEEMGNLTRVQPILVNDQMEIIDGQHRFTACQELGQPIYYTKVSGLGVSDARKINVLHRSWTFDDYAHSYAKTGDASYQRYLKLQEDYGFSNSIILVYTSGGKNPGIYKEFREGNYVLTPDDDKKARFYLELLADVAEKYPIAKSRDLAIALFKIERVEGFDHNRLMDKLERYNAMLTRQGGIMEYVRLLEEIYNKNQTEGTKLRLF